MAISVQERRLIILALFSAHGEGGYPAVAQMVKYLVSALPSIAWEAELRTQAASWQPFLDTGLSITWWCDEVMRLANTS